jgi:hypothetical protein
MKKWFKAAGVRAIKTVAQAAISAIGSAAVLSQVNWKVAISTAVLAGILSLLTSIAGLPELDGADDSSTRPDSIAHTMTDDSTAKTDKELKEGSAD